MLPLILVFLNRFKNSYKVILAVLVLFPLGIFFCPELLRHRMFYVNPLYRITDFAIGILLYNIYEAGFLKDTFKSRSKSTIFEILSVVIFLLFFAFHNHITYGYRYSCYYWIPMSVIIFVFSFQSGFISKLLSNKAMVFLGEISYGFYLIHYLVIKYATSFINKFDFVINDYILIFALLIIVLIASYFAHILIEVPANQIIKMKAKHVFSFGSGKSSRGVRF